MENVVEKIKGMAMSQPLLRVEDVRTAGLPTMVLSRMVEHGQLDRLARGIYCRPDQEFDENLSLSIAAARIPKAVFVLISALNFHAIGTQPARAVWMQLPHNAVKPRIDHPPIEIVRTRLNEAFSAGVEEHMLNGIPVRITSPARTVADCFKHRKKLGLDLCLEALREVVPTRCKPGEILSYAKMNRVERILLPYLEVLGA
jgi:predicted transcriptional regulator of viral defense system